VSRILEFEIRGLAGRRKMIRRRLHGDLNVFWGMNGSGKTSLLKILHSALTNDARILARVPFTSARVTIEREPDNVYVRTIEKESLEPLLASMQTLSGTDEFTYLREYQLAEALLRKESMGWVTQPELSKQNGSFRHGYLPISRISEGRGGTRPGRRAVSESIDEATFDKLFATQIQELWQEYNSRASFAIRTAQERGLGRILTHLLSSSKSPHRPSDAVQDADEAYLLVKGFIQEQRFGRMVNIGHAAFLNNYANNPLVQEVVAEVAEVQRSVDQALRPQRKIEELLGQLYFGRKTVELQGRHVIVMVGSEPIALEHLSSGEKQLLQLLLECLTAGDNPVIIDEPELSLHVDWQQQLVEHMQSVNSNAQLIMATHSPEVMSLLSDNNIIEL